MKKVSISLLALAAALAISPAAVAGTIVYDDPANQATQSFDGNLANFFTVNSPVTVDELGVFNALGGGNITGFIQVGIASVDIDTGATTAVTPTVTFHGSYASQGFGYDVFQSITPVTLAPGLYEVDAVGFSGSDPNGNLHLGSSGPKENSLGGALTFDNSDTTYSDSISLTFPTDFSGASVNGGIWDDGNTLYDAGTFEVGTPSPVPEPSSLLLLGTGLAAFAGMLRRKLRA